MTDDGDDPSVPDFLSDDGEPVPDGNIRCFVRGCPFTFASDQHAEYERHVRWIHLRTRELGDDPLPALTIWLMNGIIRPDEFSELTAWVIEDSLPRVPRMISIQYLLTLVIGVGGALGLFVAVFWPHNQNTVMLGQLAAGMALGTLIAFVLVRWDSFRITSAVPRASSSVIFTPGVDESGGDA